MYCNKCGDGPFPGKESLRIHQERDCTGVWKEGCGLGLLRWLFSKKDVTNDNTN